MYNGGSTLAAALDSLVGQTFPDMEIIVSDNGSTDETMHVCQRYAAMDSRIRYVRHERNRGADANFTFVFREAKANYFMWAAADDVRSPDFVEVNLAFLQSHPSYVGSTSPVHFEGEKFDSERMGDESLDSDDAATRVSRFFTTWHANGRFHSLFRRSAVASWPSLGDSSYLGADWTLITHLASIGKLHRSDNGWVRLGKKGISNGDQIFARYRTSFFDWVLPFRRMTLDTCRILARASIPRLLALTIRLMYFNWLAFRAQIRLHRRGSSPHPGKVAP